jgi:hypothetical protein
MGVPTVIRVGEDIDGSPSLGVSGAVAMNVNGSGSLSTQDPVRGDRAGGSTDEPTYRGTGDHIDGSPTFALPVAVAVRIHMKSAPSNGRFNGRSS